MSFIKLGKERDIASVVQSLTDHFVHRSLPNFTRFFGQNVWDIAEVAKTALDQFFHIL
jgi:hypothetical protein